MPRLLLKLKTCIIFNLGKKDRQPFYVIIKIMSETLFIFFASLVLLIFGARLFLKTSISLARILHLPELVIGATLVAVVTTLPETLVSLFASATGHVALALGNVVGSGLVNLGLLFGIILLVGQKSSETGGRGKRRSLILFGLVFFVYLWFLILGKMGLVGGLILIALAFVYLGYTCWYAFKEFGGSLVRLETSLETHLPIIFKFLGGAFLTILGARFLVQSGVTLAQVLGVPEILIGLTLIAVGTSLPELATALMALTTGHSRISMGNLTGATIINFTLALGLAATLTEIQVPVDILQFDFLLLLLFSGLGVIFAFSPRISQKAFGIFLIAGYFFYLFYLFFL